MAEQRKAMEAAEERRNQEREARESAAKLRIEEEIKKLTVENEVKEKNEYKQMKEAYDHYFKRLKSVDRDTVKGNHMSDLAYVITSVVVRGVTPKSAPAYGIIRPWLRDNQDITKQKNEIISHLNGIFTSCKSAQECARKVFERISKSYRNGSFIPIENRIAKSDITEFIVDNVRFNGHVMFEAFKSPTAKNMSWEYPDYAYDITMVSLNVIQINTECKHLLQFTPAQHDDDEKFHPYEEFAIRKNTNQSEFNSAAEVYVVFAQKPREGRSPEVNLHGVFTYHDDAVKCGLTERKALLQLQKQRSPHVRNGMKMYEMLSDNSNSVVIESMHLDCVSTNRETGNKLEFRTKQVSGDIGAFDLRAIDPSSLLGAHHQTKPMGGMAHLY